ncbi:MAG TPA: glycosyltransferase family 2 protein [Caulobacterales bacterium]|nr:glycosyltransferase family 2 protein [Caulobacterales bacterium]
MSAAMTEQRDARAAPVTGAEIAVVVPTFNERDNVLELKNRLAGVLQGRAWELVFVDDDSKDGTYDVLRAEALRDPRVRVLERIGRRGLSTAVVEGILSTTAPLVAVMDADLQHDEQILPAMIAKLEAEKADLVVASRYADGGGLGEWQQSRQAISRFATKLSRLVVKADLSDPMSGFFLIRRAAFDRAVRGLSAQGYKILLDIVASAKPPLKVAEAPYTFRARQHGESKLDSAVTLEYLMLLADKLVGHLIPLRFMMFAFVGGLGVLVHMATLFSAYRGLHLDFPAAQITATFLAMTFNFFVNNMLTYRDKRLKGFWEQARGLLSFYVVCSFGAVANVGIAEVMFAKGDSWWLAGVAGTLVGAVWNYAASSIFTWRK